MHDVDAGVSGQRRQKEAGLTEKSGIGGEKEGGAIVAGMTSDHAGHLPYKGTRVHGKHCARPHLCT